MYLDSTSRSFRLRPTLNDVDLAYKIQLSPNRAIQFGLGLEAYYQENSEEIIYDDPEFNDRENKSVSKNLSWILSAQYLLYKRIEPNFFLFWGPGLSVHIRPTTKYTYGTSNYFHMRLHANAGFEWFISRRLSFISETSFYFTYSERYDEYDNRNMVQKRKSKYYNFGYYITEISMAFYLP